MSPPAPASDAVRFGTGRRGPWARGAERVVSGVVLALSAGCAGPTVAELQADLKRREEELAQRDQKLQAAADAIEQLRTALLQARGLDPQRWERAFRPVELEIASLSGGADYDGRPGDDGVNVYLRPIDRDGDVVKVAGEIRVQLYDLAAVPGRQLVGEYRVPAAECGKYWYGKLLTQHFTIKCPWPAAPPAHDEITIRASFIDDLTGNIVTAQGTCRVELAR